MRAPQSNLVLSSPVKKAPRRSPDWQEESSLLRAETPKHKPDAAAILPFPGRTPADSQECLEARRQRVSTRWSESERVYRRLQALRKQEELWLLLAGDDLEAELRSAVADGEQPVLIPELEGLGA
jgi:hypothetical protein